jgi:hypothetical protein
MSYDLGRWSGGLAEWTEGDTAFLSVAFTWRLNEAYSRACWHRAAGYKVKAGGPGIFPRKHFLSDVAQIGGDIPDAIVHHNPMATIASRGCPVGCWFCIVPKMEGKSFTLLPDFPVRPVLCDNNLSALPADYQQHIVDRYLGAGVPLLDANSGFEPATFDDEVFARWQPILRGPWRSRAAASQRRPFTGRFYTTKTHSGNRVAAASSAPTTFDDKAAFGILSAPRTPARLQVAQPRGPGRLITSRAPFTKEWNANLEL